MRRYAQIGRLLKCGGFASEVPACAFGTLTKLHAGVMETASTSTRCADVNPFATTHGWRAHSASFASNSAANDKADAKDIPIDPEHVNISNEIQKQLAKATEARDVEMVLSIVNTHKEAFEGPAISDTLVALQDLCAGLPQDQLVQKVHRRQEFGTLLELVMTRTSFDAFTLFHTADALAALRVDAPDLLRNINVRLTNLVQALGPKHLKALSKMMAEGQFSPSTTLVATMEDRHGDLKDDMHRETYDAIDVALDRLSNNSARAVVNG